MVIQENEISLTETYSCLIREQQVQPENWVKSSIFYGIYHFCLINQLSSSAQQSHELCGCTHACSR